MEILVHLSSPLLTRFCSRLREKKKTTKNTTASVHPTRKPLSGKAISTVALLG